MALVEPTTDIGSALFYKLVRDAKKVAIERSGRHSHIGKDNGVGEALPQKEVEGFMEWLCDDAGVVAQFPDGTWNISDRSSSCKLRERLEIARPETARIVAEITGRRVTFEFPNSL